METSPKFWPTVIGSILVAGLAWTGIWWWYRENVAPLELIPSPTQTQDETSTWKTYRNEKYGFEFKYPERWNLITNDNPGSDTYNLVRVVNPDRPERKGGWTNEQFVIAYLIGECSFTGDWIKIEQIFRRDVCLKPLGQDSLSARLVAYDEDATKVMDQILSTFKFTE